MRARNRVGALWNQHAAVIPLGEMLLPYNVDRTTRAVPVVTWTLFALNIFCFLLSVTSSNLAREADRAAGVAAITQLAPVGAGDVDAFGDANAGQVREYQQYQALKLASKDVRTPDGYQKFWQIQHAYDGLIFEPHWSFLNVFAYHVEGTAPLARFLSMFSAMFVHADIEHLGGNLLFLWVFGRATEEFLGWRFFLSIYGLAGIGATVFDHIMTLIFSPASAGIPNMGASGAIAGVLGLFAVRFYRTKVRVFYLLPWAQVIFGIIFVIALLFLAMILPISAALVLGLVLAACAMFAIGKNWAWGAFRAPSVWVIGGWVVIFNIVPALYKLIYPSLGGVAYWAHIGGFALGALYALMIGGADEGKVEYQIEDAQTSLQTASSQETVARADAILKNDADNAKAHEIAALGYERQKAPEKAVEHFQKALESYWKSGERTAALRLYGLALQNHPQLALRPALLLNLAGAYAQDSMWNEALAVWVRLIEEFPGSPEAEIAFLRSAQTWMRHFNDAGEAVRQLELFLSLYPLSSWRPQAELALQGARAALEK